MRSTLLPFVTLFELICVVSTEKAYFLEEGSDQTYATEVDQSNGVNGQILDLLGLDNPTSAPLNKRNDKVATYMEELYKQIESEDQSLENNQKEKKERSTWGITDRILALTPEEVSAFGDSMVRMAFNSENLLSQGKKSILTQSELHLFFKDTDLPIVVKLFYEKESKLIETVRKEFPAGTKELTLNSTECIYNWIHNSVSSSMFVHISSGELLDSFIVAGFVDDVPPVKKRERRSVNSMPTSVNQHDKNDDEGESSDEGGGCRRHGLYVNFENLGWKSWIIAPEGYSAFYCGGGCSFPMNNRMNASNHAIVQTLAHSVHPSRAENTKCAPTVLTSLKILFIDNHQNVVMKKYKDMVVQECACH